MLDAEASFEAYSIRLGDSVSPGVMSNFDFMVVETVDLKPAANFVEGVELVRPLALPRRTLRSAGGEAPFPQTSVLLMPTSV